MLREVIPPAFRVAGYIVLETVLLDLQSVVERSIKLLNSHLYWALQKNTQTQPHYIQLKVKVVISGPPKCIHTRIILSPH